MTNINYRFPDYNAVEVPGFPQVPDELIVYDSVFEDYSFIPSRHTDMVLRNGEMVSGRLYSRKDIDRESELEHWVKTNIVPQYTHCAVSKYKGPCLGPHMDKSRFYNLQYIYETGGSNVQTVFYEPKTNEAILEFEQLYVTDYNKLDVVEVFKLEPRKWYLINTRSLHSVEDIETMRIALQIGLMKNPIGDFKERGVL